MIIVEQSAKLLSYTSEPEILLERAGRVCYKSEEKITPESAPKFVEMICQRNHESVLEHAVATILFTTDRGITQELVRHRLCSYCMSGDTIVPAYSETAGNSGKRWTIRQLYEWSCDPSRKGRLKLIRLRSVDEHGRLVPGRIKSVVASGVKPVLRITTESGRFIVATKEHRVLTPTGWRRCGHLTAGDFLMANGKFAIQSKEWITEHYINRRMSRPEVAALAGVSDALMGKWVRLHGIEKPLNLRKNRKPGHGVKGMHGDTGRALITQRMQEQGNHRWKGDMVGPSGGRMRAWKMYKADVCAGCGATKDVERHHVDENPINNHPDNIKLLCPKCHKAWHLGQGVRVVFKDRIVSIEEVGTTSTYDIEMHAPYHNFVADGVIVHNSQESTRYVNYYKKGEIRVVKPLAFKSEAGEKSWHRAMLAAETEYNLQIEGGEAPEVARDSLPTCTAADIVVTANFRQWKHIIKLRTAKAAHPKIRLLIGKAWDLLLGISPTVFKAGA